MFGAVRYGSTRAPFFIASLLLTSSASLILGHFPGNEPLTVVDRHDVRRSFTTPVGSTLSRIRSRGHHPDMSITWQRIRFTITTHDAGGRITLADFELARHIDAIAEAAGAAPAPPAA